MESFKKAQYSCSFFINKIDRVGANAENVIEEIKLNFNKKAFLLINH